MEQQHIALAYCIDNIQLAEQIAQELSSAGHAPQHYYGSKKSPDKPLFEQLRSHSGQILLLITDNFLRSSQCMAGGREFMQDNRDIVMPIVAEGIRQDESHNVYPVPTQFERISDIIQYINYWQDQYLDLRRQKRELEDEIDETTFNEHLRTVRAISGETSEFLRLLRNAEYVTLEELEESHYESVFRFIGDMKAWEVLRKDRLARVREEKPAAVAVSGSDNSIHEHDMPPVDLSEIPGMDLLADDDDDGLVPDFEEELTEDANPTLEDDTPPAEAGAGNEIVEDEELIDEAVEDEEPVEEIVEDEPEEEVIDPANILNHLHDWVSGGQTEQALDALRTGLEAHPNHLEMRYQLAHLLVKYEDNFGEARQQLGTLLKYDGHHTAALFLSGELSEIEEDFEEAVDFYQDVARIDPNFPGVHYRLGLILAHQFEDTQEQALAEFEQAVMQDPDNADAHYQFGMLLNEFRKDPAAAIPQFRDTLKLQPKHPFAYYDLALIYHSQGDMEQAKAAYQQAAALNPEVKTPENDRAFGLIAPLPEEKTEPEKLVVSETTTIEMPEIADEPVVEEEVIKVAVNEPIHNAAAGENFIEKEALAALKENILRLEEMVKARDEEKVKLKKQRPGYGKTVLITGATSGIGKATAELFASNGYRVILTGRRNDRLNELQKEFSKEYETDIHTLNFDVRNVEEVESAIDQLPKEWKAIDILINNAGKAKGLDPIHQGKLEHWEEMIDTNIKGLLYLTRAIAPAMVERGQGHIINICSTAGKEVYPNGNVYCATKHAVDALTTGMRLDLHAYNIRVSQVAPAHVEETEFAEVRFDGDKQRGSKVYENFQPLRSPDVAEAIYFIASRPLHVNVQDIVMLGTQQASSTMINRSGR
ncbi:MAG: SDR family NAD(P)-dependent oxidoreductase [Saprospiraceae bacterium]